MQQYAFFMKEGSSKKAEVPHKEDDLMTLIEAAKRLRITSGALRRWVRNGQIEAIRRPSSKSYIYIRKAVIDTILTPQ
jgi:hypothetical protein